MSLLLLFSGAGTDDQYAKPDGMSAYEYNRLLSRLQREDEQILELIIMSVLKDN
jgi:hypothetical protein